MPWWTGNITMGFIVDPMFPLWTRFNKVQQSPYIEEFRIGPRTKCGKCPGETCHTHCIKVVLGEGHLACLPSIWSISPCLPPSSSVVSHVSHCKQLSGWLMSRPHKQTHRTCFEEWSGLAGAYATCLWHHTECNRGVNDPVKSTLNESLARTDIRRMPSAEASKSKKEQLPVAFLGAEMTADTIGRFNR